MLVTEADIHEYVGMSYVDKNILGPLVHMNTVSCSADQEIFPSMYILFFYTKQVHHF